jgi:hypothetical protein
LGVGAEEYKEIPTRLALNTTEEKEGIDLKKALNLVPFFTIK